jgi:pyridoxal phosphate enzyme (YggS family)
MKSIADNLATLRAQTQQAELIVVSKTRSTENIREAIEVGQLKFGENRVQEAQKKFSGLRLEYPALELHLIGALQTNKAQAAVELFDVIQTLDRPALADALAKAIKKTGRRVRLYIEVNIGGEIQKAGIAPQKVGEFLAYCRDTCSLEITGLMCIPPKDKDPRPSFLSMRQLKDDLRLEHLSMGMSADYKAAIECGATEVRIGSAVFCTM